MPKNAKWYNENIQGTLAQTRLILQRRRCTARWLRAQAKGKGPWGWDRWGEVGWGCVHGKWNGIAIRPGKHHVQMCFAFKLFGPHSEKLQWPCVFTENPNRDRYFALLLKFENTSGIDPSEPHRTLGCILFEPRQSWYLHPNCCLRNIWLRKFAPILSNCWFSCVNQIAISSYFSAN